MRRDGIFGSMVTATEPAVCPSRIVPIQIGDKWTALIVLRLEDGPRRFSELRAALGRVTPKVLAETLRAMERDGLVSRVSFDEVPRRVEYSLTPAGRRLLPLIEAVRAWSTEHLDAILAARR